MIIVVCVYTFKKSLNKNYFFLKLIIIFIKLNIILKIKKIIRI